MRPELFRLHDLGLPASLDVGFPSYFVLLLTGFLLATASGALWARRIGQNPDVIVDLGLAMLLAGIAGGRLLSVVADGQLMDYVHMCTDPSKVDWQLDARECVSAAYGGAWDPVRSLCHPQKADCFAWAEFWAGGLTYYGGFLGASVAAWWLLRRDRFPFWKAADMAGFAVPLGLAFGRMGCLLAGCCFGAESHAPWALSFPPRSPASEAQFREHTLASQRMWSHPVHPTQVYESAASLAIAAFCLWVVHPRKRYDGQVFVAFLVLYATARFLLEFLRRDERGGLLALSTSQLIGLGLIAVAAIVHARRRPKGAAALATA